MSNGALINLNSIAQNKFQDPLVTAKGEKRATVTLTKLRTLWFNTGSLCNITCVNCYMESSPKNDAIAYLTLREVTEYLDEIKAECLDVEEIAFTGGEPFMNTNLIEMLYQVLSRGFKSLVLTNAMKPMAHQYDALLDLKQKFGKALCLRVSMDHYSPVHHEKERGLKTWEPMINGLRWLSANGFNIAVAGVSSRDLEETASPEVSNWGSPISQEPSLGESYDRILHQRVGAARISRILGAQTRAFVTKGVSTAQTIKTPEGRTAAEEEVGRMFTGDRPVCGMSTFTHLSMMLGLKLV